MAAKNQRGRKPVPNEQAGALINATSFLSIVPDKASVPNAVLLAGGLAYVNNGVLKAGYGLGESVVPVDAIARPFFSSLVGALARVGKSMDLAFADDVMMITSGDFKAALENTPRDAATDKVAPDPEIAPLNNAFRDALGKVMRLTSDTGEELMVSFIVVLGTTVMATRRHTVLEALHGNPMPYAEIYLPKAFAQALMKTDKKYELHGFGYSKGSFTVWFEGGMFLQTNTIEDAWNVEGREPGFAVTHAMKLVEDAQGTAIPDVDTFTINVAAINRITPVEVHVTLGKIASVDGVAVLNDPTMTEEFVLDANNYLAVSDLIKSMKVIKVNSPNRLLFHGDGVRGIMAVDGSVQPQQQPTTGPGSGWTQPAPEPTTEAALNLPATGWGAPVIEQTATEVLQDPARAWATLPAAEEAKPNPEWTGVFTQEAIDNAAKYGVDQHGDPLGPEDRDMAGWTATVAGDGAEPQEPAKPFSWTGVPFDYTPGQIFGVDPWY